MLPVGSGAPSIGNFSLTKSLVRLSQMSARPRFELQFNITQNAVLERMNKEVEAVQESFGGSSSKTALLQLKQKRVARELAGVQDYEATTKSNRLTVKDILTDLYDLRDLAAPATEAEFLAKRDEVAAKFDKLRTATSYLIGAPDLLSKRKTEGPTELNAIVTGGFDIQQEIDDAQAAIDNVTADMNASLTIIEINQDMVVNLRDSLQRQGDETSIAIDDVEILERKARIDAVKETQDKFGRILSVLSISFEGSQAIAESIATATVLGQERDPASILNLFD